MCTRNSNFSAYIYIYMCVCVWARHVMHTHRQRNPNQNIKHSPRARRTHNYDMYRIVLYGINILRNDLILRPSLEWYITRSRSAANVRLELSVVYYNNVYSYDKLILWRARVWIRPFFFSHDSRKTFFYILAKIIL